MRRGFTILEALVAAAILGVGCLGVLGMLITTVENNRSSRMRTEAIILAEQQLADLEATSLSGSSANSELFQDIASKTNVGWHYFTSVDAHGIHQEDGNKNHYAIGYTRLISAEHAQYIRGAIRIVWSKNGTNACAAACASNVIDFVAFDTLGARNEAVECDFITLPFAFTIP